jgi:hypothetical protein
MNIQIEVEHHRFPIKLELVREVIPLVVFCCVIACLIGYRWAWQACR